MTERLKLFKELLAAAFNVGPHIECGTDDAEATNAATTAAAEALFAVAGDSPARLAGALLTARLFAEVFTAADPDAHMRAEIRKGWDGTRHEFDTVPA